MSGDDQDRIGGFRLDDPAGEVGIEFLAVTDGSGEQRPGRPARPRTAG